MKTITLIIFTTFLVFSLNAQNVEQELIKTPEAESAQKYLDEYGYIKPVAIEEVPIRVVIVPDIIEEPSDQDDDGVIDENDKCPDTSKDFAVDTDGCPTIATLKVNFATNKYNISQEYIDDLEEFALFLKKSKGYGIHIYGHTDSIGSEEANQILSKNRADAIKEALLSHGIDNTRMSTTGKGELMPITSNETKEGRAENRRIEVELTK